MNIWYEYMDLNVRYLFHLPICRKRVDCCHRIYFVKICKENKTLKNFPQTRTSFRVRYEIQTQIFTFTDYYLYYIQMCVSEERERELRSLVLPTHASVENSILVVD